MNLPFQHRMAHLAPAAAPMLNARYECQTLDRHRLAEVLDQDSGIAGFSADLQRSHPTLYSGSMVFVSAEVAAAIQQAITTLEAVIELPGWRAAALREAPAIAQHVPRTRGVFMGYDFHIDDAGPKLIEINTNAGGAFLSAALTRAQQACCAQMQAHFSPQAALETMDLRLLQMFRQEWALARGEQPMGTVAIVDDAPRDQYLWPEFVLAQRLFQRHGIPALIADARELHWDGQRLRAGAEPIDLVYNRVTDFTLAQHPALREAYAAGAIVLTPAPAHHALYAHKANLVRLADRPFLSGIGVSAPACDRLGRIVPEARRVHADDAERWWRERAQWFFKPDSGYGSRAVYRGDKLTRRVFEEIVQGGYIAQRRVAPGERWVAVDGVPTTLKFDLRAYSYDAQVLMLVARMYEGQTTNLRTVGGGFAPVTIVGSSEADTASAD